MKVSVTWSDIENGRQHHAFACPVALACRRILDKDVFGGVGKLEVTVRNKKGHSMDYPLPEPVRNFIQEFDIHGYVAKWDGGAGYVRPLEFDIPVD